MYAKRTFVYLLIALALLGLSFGRALAKEIAGVTISGPGLPGEVEITDAAARETASAPWFDLIATGQPAELPEGGYYEIRLAIGEAENVVATSVFHYYPGAGERPGYFYYAECVGCSSSSQGDWYRIRDQEDLGLRELLVGLGAPAALMAASEEIAAPPAAAELSAPTARSVPDSVAGQSNLLIIVVVSAALLALAAFAILRRRANGPAIGG